MYVLLLSIVKDKCGKINSKDNYRLIALASKIADKILSDRISVTLSPISNQNGYKNTTWEIHIYVLKEFILRRRSLNTSLFRCFSYV